MSYSTQVCYWRGDKRPMEFKAVFYTESISEAYMDFGNLKREAYSCNPSKVRPTWARYVLRLAFRCEQFAIRIVDMKTGTVIALRSYYDGKPRAASEFGGYKRHVFPLGMSIALHRNKAYAREFIGNYKLFGNAPLP